MKITSARITMCPLFCAGLMFCVLLSGSLNAQNINFSVVRGERPPIDLSQVNADAYEPGILLIKLGSQFTDQLEKEPVNILDDGSIRFNISALDELSNASKVRNVKQYFRHQSLNNSFTPKHKAWGFHLWYQLQFETGTDIIALVKAYQALEEVETAEPEYRKMLIGNAGSEKQEFVAGSRDFTDWTPNDPQYSNQWHYHNTGQQSGTPDADIDLPEAWEIEKGLSDVVVAIVDGGIQYNHPDLAANMWQNGSGHYGYNFVTGNATIEPDDHGTHVAGTVAAVNNNNVGVAGIAGGSGNGDGVRLMSCQVFTSSSGGGFHLAPVYAADNGAAISQNSWGYTSAGYYNQNVLDAIDYFNINGGGSAMTGGITIFAAGNNNSSGSFYPGYYSGTLSVAGTSNQDKKSWYSNYGTWVDISAPGGETNTVTARGVLSSVTGNAYDYYQGTSMACPHVSGVAALLLSNALRNSVPLSNSDLWELLVDNVDNHYPQNPSYLNQLGSGRLNANLALLALQNMSSGVLNPASLIATAVSTSQINLVWEKNQDNNNVMLAWSPDGVFGTPTEGMVYGAGSSLPGGGTVLYSGSNTNFNHTGLEGATNYYYKAFSYNASNFYSSGKEANTATFCGTISDLPLVENFNSSSSLPICWNVIDNQGNGQVWQVGSHVSGLTGTTGNYAYLDSDGYGSGNSQNSDLLSPLLDLTEYTNVTISFNHYFREYTGSTATLAYSINNGTSWTTIQSWTTSTTNPTVFTQTIPALAGQAAVRIKWNYTGTWGYYWDVDDIQLTGNNTSSPYADFFADPINTFVGETVTFTNASGGGNFNSWQWTFGEGASPSNVTGVGPHTVVYNTEGNKTVSLVVDGMYTETKVDYISVAPFSMSSSATYTQGDILTDYDFQTIGQSSICPGILSVDIPSGAMITSVDVSYQMTAQNNGWKSEQRSQLRCVSPGGTSEQLVFSGTGNSIGSQGYSRTGLNIANDVTEGGNIVFELHAGRTWGGSGCNSTYNKVDNNTWTITVFYEPPLPCLPPTSLIAINISAYSAEADWTAGGNESEWNVEWGLMGFVPGLGSKINGITEKPYTITDLQPGATYDFFVQSVCSEARSTSEWVGPYRFHTSMVYIIAASSNNPEFGSVSGGGVYEQGELVTLTASPAIGYYFINWTQGGIEISSEPVYAFNAISNLIVDANFAINIYTITALPNDPAFGSITGGGEYEHGETVNLQAIPNDGYHFVNWTEGGIEVEANPVYIFIATENRSLLANFAINTYTITVLPNDPAFGSITGGGDYEHGETVNLQAIPNDGYHFVNWTEGGVEVEANPVYIFNATENRSLLANFELSVPYERLVQNETIGSGEETCFDATGTIIVSSVVVENGGTAHFIAGENITIEAGFHAKQGAYVWARISDEYCSQYPSMLASEEIINSTILPLIESADKFFKVFPNPTSGNLKLMFDAGDESSTVLLEVYNIVGKQIHHFELSGQMQYDFDFSSLPGGIYFLKIKRGKLMETEKIIKY
jgi:subtilisin family serine protease